MKRAVTVIIIIALLAALGGLYTVENRRQAATSETLRNQARQNGQDISNSQDTDSSNSSSGDSGSSDGDTAATSGRTASDGKAAGISIRGDSYNTQGTNDRDSYAIDLGNLLAEAGDNIPVEDNTVDMAGTLTQMRYAGVSEDVINGYITTHQQTAAFTGATLSATETSVRSGLEPQENRDDLDYVPVIFMGYYGGWNGDTDELIEQQQRILDTYDQKENYIIVGYYPSDYADRSGYDNAMRRHWGDHYMLMNTQIEAAAMTTAGRQEMAQAIFNKLTELGYI